MEAPDLMAHLSDLRQTRGLRVTPQELCHFVRLKACRGGMGPTVNIKTSLY